MWFLYAHEFCAQQEETVACRRMMKIQYDGCAYCRVQPQGICVRPNPTIWIWGILW